VLTTITGEAFVPLSTDPLLVWNYGAMAVVSAVAGVCFFFFYRDLDKEEDRLNMLPIGHMGTKTQEGDLEAKRGSSSARGGASPPTEAVHTVDEKK
jgi:POT family proton-dependent oligopeptide transporter